ncbi:MAG: Ig-like domain-containing protein [Candidatus Verstraetearchaeota archaeon]|nr:Ig-like domain-containing protein [Candidatus Verstraetearchaeota archaeon]
MKSPKFISTAALMILILASMTPLALAAFSVSTDRAYYKPGDSIIISITGATPNDVVTLQINSTPTNILWVYEVTTDSSGSANVTVVASWDWLAGKPDESFTVYAKDQGTQTLALTTFDIDAQRPAVFIAYPLPGSCINNPRPTMVATYFDNVGVDVNRVFLFLDNVNVTAQAQQINATHAVYTPSADLPEGVHNFTIVVFDLAGNMNSTFSIFTIDYTAPEFYNFTPANNTLIANAQPLIAVNFTDNTGINYTSIIMWLNGTDVTAQANIYAGGIAYTPPAPLAERIWNACVYLEDIAGNENSTFWLFTVDITPPLASNFKPANGSTISNTKPLIAANYTDLHDVNTSAVRLYLNGKDVTLKATVKPTYIAYRPAADLPEKKHTVVLYIEDMAGNGKNYTWSFTISIPAPPPPPDTEPPEIYNLRPAPGSTVSTATPTISASYRDNVAIDVDSVRIYVDGVDVTAEATVTASSVTYVPPAPLSEGMHTVRVKVADTSGNTNEREWWFNVKLPDTTPPTIVSVTPPDGATVSTATPTISASYTDDTGIDVNSVRLYVDGVDVTSEATVTASSVTYTPTTLFANNTGHTARVEVADLAGNTAEREWSFTVRLPPAPPAVELASLTLSCEATEISPGDPVTLTLLALDTTGSGMPGVTAHIYIDDIYYTTVGPTNEHGEVTLTIPAGVLVEVGTHTIYAAAEGITSNTVTIEVLSIAPPPVNFTTSLPAMANVSLPAEIVEQVKVLRSMMVYSEQAVESVTISTEFLPLAPPDVTPPEGVVYAHFKICTIPKLDFPVTAYLEVKVSKAWIRSHSIALDSITMMAYINESWQSISMNLIGEDDHFYYFSVVVEIRTLFSIVGTAVTDTEPPTIYDLQPAPDATVTEVTPTISAKYNDNTGIDIGSVKIYVDGVDVTANVTITASQVTYTPAKPLTAGVHTVKVTVADIYGNKAEREWSFTIVPPDTEPPEIYDLHPAPDSEITETKPTISAKYRDPSGISVNSVKLYVDGVDVTSKAAVTESQVTYTPEKDLSTGSHTVKVTVADIYGNKAEREWSFTITAPFPWPLVIAIIIVVVVIIAAAVYYAKTRR